MKKIVIAGRNDAGKSTLLGEVYRGLKSKDFQPLAIGSGVQDEKPYLQKGIDPNYLTIAQPNPGEDVIGDIERVIRAAINQIKEKNNLVKHARRALEELNKVRSVLELGNLLQKDIPNVVAQPNVILVEAVGINDGYRSVETKKQGDILVTIVPANIKSEIIMEQGNILLDESDIIVVTKGDITPKEISSSNIKLLQRIYRDKPIIPVVATDGVHMNLVIDEIAKRLDNPKLLLDMIEHKNP
jgi:hypothetical protein